MRYVVGISGASGAILARAAVERIVDLGHEALVVATRPAHVVWVQELDEQFAAFQCRLGERGVRFFAPDELGAPIASGSYPVDGAIVIPCSVGTVAAIAHGHAANLLQRAADVAIKEGRRLVVVPRETPLSAIHLQNLLALAQLGVRIVPPVPAFYTRPTMLGEIVDQIVGRALAALGVPGALEARFVYEGPDVAGE